MSTIIKLKEHFDKAISKPVDLEAYVGDNWWQITSAEAEVFGLELEDVPPLAEAWQLYEAIIGILCDEFCDSPLCLEARAALPFIEARLYDEPQWTRFAALLGIPSVKAFAWFYKVHFDMEEAGGIIRDDENDPPMPRAAVLPKPTHPPATDWRDDLDDLIPF